MPTLPARFASKFMDPEVKARPGPQQARPGFSLIEVVLALGVFSFVIVLLIGLLSSGIETGKESAEKVQAANLASMLVTKRRICPVDQAAPLPHLPADFALPPLDTNASSYVSTGLGLNGLRVPASASPYLLTYKITQSAAAAPRVARLHLILSWPGAATLNANAETRYELSTQIELP